MDDFARSFTINVQASGSAPAFGGKDGAWFSDATTARFTLDSVQKRVPPQVAAIGSWRLDRRVTSPFKDKKLDWAWACYHVEYLSSAERMVAPPNFFYDPHDSAEPTSRYLYMFNVLVALEWTPTAEELTQLKWTFRKASDFLFDVTNGAMMFGQVVFGDAQRLVGADFQIFASTRLHPRSWVAGLYFTGDSAEQTRYKFMPIRVGRGAWDKETSSVIDWNEPEGYRILAHEWAHYALGLRDRYLEPHADLSIPTFNLASNDIMAQLHGASELVLQNNSTNSFAGLHSTFTRLDERQVLEDNIGPEVLPFPFPLFHVTFEPDKTPTHFKLNSLDLKQINNCWLYVVRGDFRQPKQIIAQGSLDEHTLKYNKPFAVLGAENNDYVVALIDHGAKHEAAVRIGKIQNDQITWLKHEVKSAAPLLAVVPVGGVDYTKPTLPTYSLRVMVEHDQAPSDVFVASLGATRVRKAVPNQKIANLPSLDGCVMCVWGEGEIPEQIAFAHYSEGGAPPSHNPGAPIPMSAGSSEGNVMIFFNPQAQSREAELAATRLVTTTMYVAAPDLNVANGTPRSYVFALASNAPLPRNEPNKPQLMPSLVMNHDNKLLQSWYSSGGKKRLQIYRYTANTMQATDSQHFPERAYVALALNPSNAANLFSKTPKPIFVRMYLVEE